MNLSAKIVTFLFFSFLATTLLKAQSLPVGMPVMEDYFRRNQLLGIADSNISHTIRPLSSSITDSTKLTSDIYKHPRFQIKVLPLSWQQQVNTDYPYDWNDGLMIPAKGYQTFLSPGFYALYGPLSIQLKPEMVLAENKNFDGFSPKNSEFMWETYYGYFYNLTDQPEIFGNGVYSKTSWGQSNIKLTFDPVSIALSNENLWWGPGIRNSLLMSNTAPGFKHITLNTSKPIHTPVGAIEGQLIAGRLDNSGYLPPGYDRTNSYYSPKRDEWRYLSAGIITYQPKWVPGLFLGISRAFQIYHTDVNDFWDYIPLLQPFAKNKTNEDKKLRDQLASVFFRWVWPSSKAEIYAEYGRNDHSANTWDFLLEPQHSRAYLLGLRKVFPLKNTKEDHLQLFIEFTQMSQSANRITREAGSWYIHGQVRHGYTHQGQVLGAGTGSSGDLQCIEVSWFRKAKKIGLQFERYVHNNDFYLTAFQNFNVPLQEWVDIITTLKGGWDYKNFLFNSSLSYINTLNYQWGIVQGTSEESRQRIDKKNFQIRVGVNYLF